MKKVRFFLLFATMLLLASVCCSAAGVEDPVTRKLARFGAVEVSGTDPTAKRVKGKSHGKNVDLSAWGLDGSLDSVHGMYYMAVLKKTYTAASADSVKEKVRVKKGENVVILYYPRRNGTTICRLKNKRTVRIPAKRLRVLYYIYNSSSAYTDAQIEEWVASNRITSKTKYMFLASKFNQHGWILTKESGSWVCKYVLNITTGAYTNGDLPNDCYPLNSCAIRTHYINKRVIGTGISYASKYGGNQIHYMKSVLYPSSHGCIAMKRRDYNFVYWYLPYGTRVVLF